ncbi:protease inhibitor I9 family protein [Streptomyces hydrogenans]|uniref:protease inhibitor I9 family protein n=1 Tax=Streptomyces hydrogenans TaxID=1873719 RepID=UPI0035D7F5B8
MSLLPRRTPRDRRAALAALLTSALAALSLPLATTATATPAAAPITESATGTYLVTLADEPLVTYDGGVGDLPATKPAQGGKLDVASAAAQRYRAHLTDQQTRVAKKVGATVRQHYAVTTNTFSARLDARQLVRLARTGSVVHIAPDRFHHATDDRTPPTSSNSPAATGCGRPSVEPPKPARASSSATSTRASGPRTPPSPPRP